MFKTLVQDLFAQVSSIEIAPNLIEIPQDRSMGDFALPCFSFAKELKKAPNVIAQEIADELSPSGIIAKVEAMGPYVNVSLDTGEVAKQVIEEVMKSWDTYWSWEDTWKKILLEWRSPNTHKMLHIGHLRNALVSETISSINEFAGNKVHRTAYGGDIGAHVAKWIWYYVNFTDKTYPTDPEEFGIWSWDLYAKATAEVVNNEDEYKNQIHEVQRLLETGDKEMLKIWNETRELSIAGLKNVFEELGCTIDRYFRESEVEQPWIELVKKYEADESIPLIKKSEGAIIADLEEEDLWVCVLLKSNGTSLYSTKDIALAYLKEEEYDFDVSLYVVATEQNHHFKQVFRVLDLWGYDTSKLHHVWYELVELPDGKMSSRKWTIIPYHVWRNDAKEIALNLINEREIENKEEVSEMIAFAALKFSMLLQDTYKKIRIDINNSISFDGETGPYLQYTYARSSSILRKAESEWFKTFANGEEWSKPMVDWLNKDTERLLALHLSEFSEVVQRSANEYKPSLVARYVLDLCRMFNAYYQQSKVLIEDDPSWSQARLALVASVQQVLKTGLKLLWIEAPVKM